VVLFTRSLALMMGYRSQFILYGYYFGAAWILRQLSPPLPQMLAQEAALSGAYRSAHQAWAPLAPTGRPAVSSNAIGTHS
jgi:hypothetical protein